MYIGRECNCHMRDLLLLAISSHSNRKLLWFSSFCLYTPLKLLVNLVDSIVI